MTCGLPSICTALTRFSSVIQKQMLNSAIIYDRLWCIFCFSDASLIANYDVKRCYEVDITFHYKIPGGLKSSTIDDTKTQFSSVFNTLTNLLGFSQLVPQCTGVIITKKEITASPPGVTSVFFRVPVIFTAGSGVPDGQVSSKLTNCINTATSDQYKGMLDSNTPGITEGGTIHSKYNLSTISDKRSCCGGDIPPPCCATGSIKVSSTKCGKSYLFYHSLFLNLAVLFQTLQSQTHLPGQLQNETHTELCEGLEQSLTASIFC